MESIKMTEWATQPVRIWKPGSLRKAEIHRRVPHIIRALERRNQHLKQENYTIQHHRYELRPPVVDIRDSLLLKLMTQREQQLRRYNLALSIEERLHPLKIIVQAGVSQAGKTTTLREIDGFCSIIQQWYDQSIPSDQWNDAWLQEFLAITERHDFPRALQFGRIRLKTTRQPRDIVERDSSPEYDFISWEEGEARVREHFIRARHGAPTDIVACAYYSGNLYFLLAEELERVIFEGKPIFFPWQREFVLAVAMVLPLAETEELLPMWLVNLLTHFRPQANLTDQDYLAWMFETAQWITNLAFDDSDVLPDGTYPKKRSNQTQEDYLWRLIYSFGSALELLRDVEEGNPLPMVDAIRLMPWGNDLSKIRHYTVEAAGEIIANTSTANGQEPFLRIPGYIDIRRRVEILSDYLRSLNAGPIPSEIEPDWTLDPNRWATQYGLANGWGKRDYGLISPMGTIWPECLAYLKD